MSSVYRTNRRVFLVGSGKALLGLPLISELLTVPGARAAIGTPKRLLTVFYANGFPRGLANLNFSGPALEPLIPFRDNLALLKGVDASGSTGRLHDGLCMAFARGTRLVNGSRSGGPSLDFRAAQEFRDGSTVDILSAGLGGNQESLARYVMSWRSQTNYARPLMNPADLFKEIFGQAANMPLDPNSMEARRSRVRKSILDAMVDSYKAVTAQRSQYSPDTKRKVASHLERIREMERRVGDSQGTLREKIADLGFVNWAKQIDTTGWIRPIPNDPSKPRSLEYEDDSGFVPGIIYITTSEWGWVWPLMIEMMAVALQTNYVQFGSLLNGAGGERYFAPRSAFPDGFPSTSLAKDHHDYYHSREPGVERFVGWYMKRNAEVLKILSKDEYKDEDGKTLLDTTAVFIGPEMDQSHSSGNMTYVIAGAKECFNAGAWDHGRRATDVDVYNTILNSMGADVGGPGQNAKKFGDSNRFNGFLPFGK